VLVDFFGRKKMRWGNVFAVLSVMLLAVAAPAEAQEAAAQGGVNWVKAFAAFGLALAAFGGALAQGKIITAAVESIARNPGAAGQMFLPWLLGIVFVESLVIYALVVVFLA
jgi:F-type H+-transporting ATPase subunit c